MKAKWTPEKERILGDCLVLCVSLLFTAPLVNKRQMSLVRKIIKPGTALHKKATNAAAKRRKGGKR